MSLICVNILIMLSWSYVSVKYQQRYGAKDIEQSLENR